VPNSFSTQGLRVSLPSFFPSFSFFSATDPLSPLSVFQGPGPGMMLGISFFLAPFLNTNGLFFLLACLLSAPYVPQILGLSIYQISPVPEEPRLPPSPPIPEVPLFEVDEVNRLFRDEHVFFQHCVRASQQATRRFHPNLFFLNASGSAMSVLLPSVFHLL